MKISNEELVFHLNKDNNMSSIENYFHSNQFCFEKIPLSLTKINWRMTFRLCSLKFSKRGSCTQDEKNSPPSAALKSHNSFEKVEDELEHSSWPHKRESKKRKTKEKAKGINFGGEVESDQVFLYDPFRV